jgi:hypothetical protein
MLNKVGGVKVGTHRTRLGPWFEFFKLDWSRSTSCSPVTEMPNAVLVSKAFRDFDERVEFLSSCRRCEGTLDQPTV